MHFITDTSIYCWTEVHEHANDLSRLMTKPTKGHVRPAKTQISLGIRPVWSESSLCVQRVAKTRFLHADSKASDHTGWMPRLIWVYAGRTGHFVGFVMRWLISDEMHSDTIAVRRLTTPLFCTHVWDRVWNVKTAVEPFREKNNNVKPASHKIYQGRYYLLVFSSLNIYFLLQFLRSRKRFQCLLAQRSVSSSFVLKTFEFLSKSLRATGWSKNAKIVYITTDNASFIWNL